MFEVDELGAVLGGFLCAWQVDLIMCLLVF